MNLLPVIDLLQGQVVRGVAGQRDAYRPIRSLWSEDADPLHVAAGLQVAFDFRRFYVADLDGIMHRRPNLDVYQRLAQTQFGLLIDAGVCNLKEAQALFENGAVGVIAGLESLPGPELLAELVREFGPERIVFSLDLRGGVPQLAQNSAWIATKPLEIAEVAVANGITRMIVLDLADVGVGTGGSTADLCRSIRQLQPSARLITGGGVRGIEDVRHWETLEIEDLLVASALHDGRLSPEVVRKWSDGMSGY